jgi:hypothetical protein
VQAIDVQWNAEYLFLTSLLRRRGGLFANPSLVRNKDEKESLFLWEFRQGLFSIGSPGGNTKRPVVVFRKKIPRGQVSPSS